MVEREITQEEIQDLIEKVLLNETQYKTNSKSVLSQVSNANERTIIVLAEACKQVLNSSDSSPMSKLLAARLLKEAMDQNVFFMCEKMKEDCLQIFEIFALYEKDSLDEKKGEKK